MHNIGVIGYGNVGNFIFSNVQASPDLSLMWICSRHLQGNADTNICPIYNNVIDIPILPDITIICTRDMDIEQIVQDIVAKFHRAIKGHLFLHTSGSNDRGILGELAKLGASIATAHPFQTITSDTTDVDVVWGIECSAKDEPLLKLLIEKLGGTYYLLPPSVKHSKPLYHAVSVAASNYVSAAIHLAAHIADEIGLDKSVFLPPIIQQSVTNALSGKEITGPIVRNDTDTIQQHLDALSALPYLQNSYQHFAQATSALLQQEKNVSKIILGLGNPGDKYAYTRHNIGFMVADALLEKHNANWTNMDGLIDYAEILINGRKIVLARPLTYMNESGRAAKWLLDKYHLSPMDLLVIVDEYNFPLGKLHLKAGSSDGGHNGIASIIEELGSREFQRLRCGIAKNFGANELADYVLSPFSAEEIPTRDIMITQVVAAVEYYVVNVDNLSFAMSRINADNSL